MMKKILLIQSRTSPARIEQERINFTRAVGNHASLEFLSALDPKFARKTPDQILEEYDGVMFGGSSDFDFNGGREERDPGRVISFIILSRVRSTVAYALASDFPMLGICFGHQIIAQYYGGEVINDPVQRKIGAYEITLTPEGKKDSLFKMFPETFYAQYDHKDSASKLPTGATPMASAPNCRFAALRYGPKAYTVQFHPEVERLNYVGEYDFHESAEASNLIPLWIGHIVGGKKPASRSKTG